MVDDVEKNPTSSAAEENSNIKDESAPTSNFQVVTTVPTNEEDNNVVNDEEDIENPTSPVLDDNLESEKATDNDNPTTTSQTQDEVQVKRNINSYYGHKVGAISTISLILNAGLMIYAHRKCW